MKQEYRNGITGLEALLLVFIVLKLTKVISWSWWWVLSPFWIPAGIALIAIGIYIFINMNKRK